MGRIIIGIIFIKINESALSRCRVKRQIFFCEQSKWLPTPLTIVTAAIDICKREPSWKCLKVAERWKCGNGWCRVSQKVWDDDPWHYWIIKWKCLWLQWRTTRVILRSRSGSSAKWRDERHQYRCDGERCRRDDVGAVQSEMEGVFCWEADEKQRLHHLRGQGIWLEGGIYGAQEVLWFLLAQDCAERKMAWLLYPSYPS